MKVTAARASVFSTHHECRYAESTQLFASNWNWSCVSAHAEGLGVVEPSLLLFRRQLFECPGLANDAKIVRQDRRLSQVSGAQSCLYLFPVLLLGRKGSFTFRRNRRDQVGFTEDHAAQKIGVFQRHMRGDYTASRVADEMHLADVEPADEGCDVFYMLSHRVVPAIVGPRVRIVVASAHRNVAVLLGNEWAQTFPVSPVAQGTVHEHDGVSLAFLDIGELDLVHVQLLHLHLFGGATGRSLPGVSNDSQ